MWQFACFGNIAFSGAQMTWNGNGIELEPFSSKTQCWKEMIGKSWRCTFASKLWVFSSKVLVEHVLQAAQKASQGPGKATWSSVVKHPALQLSLLFDGNRREWGHPHQEVWASYWTKQEAEAVKGSNRRFGLDLAKMFCNNKDKSVLLQIAGEWGSYSGKSSRISVKMVRLLHPGVGWPSLVLSRLFSVFFL